MNKVEVNVKHTLRWMGVRQDLLGYVYLADAIAAVVENPEALTGVVKGLYVDIARAHDTKYSRVERAIRHAIDESYTAAPLNVLEEVFSNTVQFDRTKPTAKHYIAAVADYVRDRLEEEVS